MRTLKTILFLTGIFGFFMITAQPHKPFNITDATGFIKQAYVANLYQIKTGTIAMKNAKDGGVRSFGSQMVADQGQMNGQLHQLIQLKGFQLSNADTTDVNIDKAFTKNTGADFDTYYISQMVSADKDLVALYETASNSSTDPDVRAFAAKNLTVLKDHLSSIKALSGQLNTVTQ